jgi:hypothetical protein
MSTACKKVNSINVNKNISEQFVHRICEYIILNVFQKVRTSSNIPKWTDKSFCW